MNLNNMVHLKDDIVIFENFLTPEQCKSIIDYWDHSVNKGTLPWDPISFYESYASNLPNNEDVLKFNLPLDFFEELENNIKLGVEKARGGGMTKVSYHAQKWITGGFARFHSDNSTDGEYNAFERSKWATFVYLNDDFDGGELAFKDSDIVMKPKVGMLAAFNGGAHNEHEVRLIKSGTRYTIGSFWDYAESEYSDEKKAQWEEEIRSVREQQAQMFKEWEEARQSGLTPNA
jgi:hypothetical protein